ncbi:hypothetical protein KO494_08870 [Lacinutrix sp. C3R15]|uniref:hypothetical protein n=1 Tax=Flavobacteriaceae TaxID=49546 RepID=UPI001C07F6B5|nr:MULTISPECIES: hypothetical protein [Flavobacteriaceae]MBU2939648.1 hypothetical protein [Lacinutrix sp. C3R15]MDO6622963.1 hypothetical protein [Oceanihabitans sp. 1_MG-2023]
MKSIFSFLIVSLIFFGNYEKQQVDTIMTNAKVYTVNANFENAEAFAIKEGKFVAVGSATDINTKFEAKKNIDAKGKLLFQDLSKQLVNLVGTTSFEEVVKRVKDFQDKRNMSFIIGRGCDQKDWKEKEIPNIKVQQTFINGVAQ